jgi:hypothetical protein
MKHYWFKAKRYGWGWYPASWQGWVILVGFICLICWNLYRVDSMSYPVSDSLSPFIIENIFLVVLLIGICYLTGEPPKWRWGDKKKSK